jgi:hypothetical protein
LLERGYQAEALSKYFVPAMYEAGLFMKSLEYLVWLLP